MRDVARAAGVSVTTVSYVLAKRRDVNISKPTWERVHREARRLNYRHNALAADLRRGASRLVGIQLYSLGVPILAQKVGALEQELRAAGYYPFLCHALDVDAETAFYHECASRRARGVILTAPPSPEVRAALRQLMADRIPVVASEPVPELGIPHVTVDRGGGAETATAHLLRLGHRRIAALVGFSGHAAEDFTGGYRRALAAAGIAWDEDLRLALHREASWPAAGEAAVQRLFDLPEPPTAILTTDDDVALGAIRALQRRGRRVPDDVAIIGCDDLPSAAYADVPLTTLAQPVEELGRQLAHLFLEGLDDPERIAGRQLRLPVQLVVRESCGARRGSPPAAGVPAAPGTAGISQAAASAAARSHQP